jgi:hypothetical protein
MRHFDEAINEFLAAHAIDPDPKLLFNIGQAYRRKGDLANAIVWFRRYLEADPTGPGSRAARSLIDKLESAVTASQSANTQPANAPNPVPSLEPPAAAPLAQALDEQEPSVQGEPMVLSDAPAPDGHSAGRIVGYVALGAGLPSLLAGTVSAVAEENNHGTIDHECNAMKVCSARGLEAVNTQRTLDSANAWTWGLGLAASAAGLAILVLSPSAAIAPTVSRAGGGVAWTGSF